MDIPAFSTLHIRALRSISTVCYLRWMLKFTWSSALFFHEKGTNNLVLMLVEYVFFQNVFGYACVLTMVTFETFLVLMWISKLSFEGVLKLHSLHLFANFGSLTTYGDLKPTCFLFGRLMLLDLVSISISFFIILAF